MFSAISTIGATIKQTVPSQVLLYYPCLPGDISGTQIADYSSGTKTFGATSAVVNGSIVTTGLPPNKTGALFLNVGSCTLNSFILGNNGFTVCYWVKPNASSGDYNTIFEARSTTTNSTFVMVCRTNGQFFFGTGNSTNAFVFKPLATFTAGAAGNWSHIAITVTISGLCTVYVNNGTPIVFSIDAVPNLGTYNSNYFGKGNINGNTANIIHLSDFRVINRVLTSTEVSSIYNNIA